MLSYKKLHLANEKIERDRRETNLSSSVNICRWETIKFGAIQQQTPIFIDETVLFEKPTEVDLEQQSLSRLHGSTTRSNKQVNTDRKWRHREEKNNQQQNHNQNFHRGTEFAAGRLETVISIVVQSFAIKVRRQNVCFVVTVVFQRLMIESSSKSTRKTWEQRENNESRWSNYALGRVWSRSLEINCDLVDRGPTGLGLLNGLFIIGLGCLIELGTNLNESGSQVRNIETVDENERAPNCLR